MLNMRPNENKNECGAIHDRKKTLTDHKHLNQDGSLGAHLLDIIHLVTCICNFQKAFFFENAGELRFIALERRKKSPYKTHLPYGD